MHINSKTRRRKEEIYHKCVNVLNYMNKKNRLHCDPEDLKIIQSIARQYHKKYGVTLYAFGSRVKGTHKQFSDLDLCYLNSPDLYIVAELEADFHDSDLPFKVELVDFTQCSPSSQEKIQSQFVPLF